MKTCLHRLLPTAILSLSSLAQPLIAQTMYDKSQYVDQVDVKISQPYTPFGNRPEFNRYGDDGSKCVLDANGVLTWTGNKGEVRLLPDSSKAVPLFVTNTECLVWVNRFVDYNTYPDRPNAQLRLYRSTPESNEVTSQDVSFQGKEIIATPQVTTTTGTLTLVSTTRKDNKKETIDNDGNEFNFSDDCELRFYRLTFDAGVQFIGSRTVQIKNAESFDTNSNGPEIQALGYGSDGSMAIKVIGERVQPKFKGTSDNPDYEGRTYWIDNQGRFLRVVEDQSFLTNNTEDPNPCSRVLSVSNTRLVYEHSTTAGVTGIQEQRRSSSTGNLLTSSIKDLTASVVGATLDIWNYSQVGVNRYFYTVNTDSAMKKFSVAGALTDGVATVTFPNLTFAGAKGGKRHFTSDGTQTPSANWYEAVWESNKWKLKKYASATVVAAQWESSNNVVTPDLATAWSPISPATGTPTITPDTLDVIPANTFICTYKLNSTGISLESTTTLAGTLEISAATVTGTVNTNDGSALLVTEDGDALIWLHAAGYTALPNSSQASALFVDKDQAVIWENAKAPVGGNGQIPNAIVKHYKQVGTVATTIRTDGNKTLLNTSRLTPDPEYWFFTTAIKTDASTSRLTTYKLGTVEIANVDTDNDGLLDYYETNTGTFVSATNTGTDPSKADSDSDGLNDGSEVTNYKTNPTDDDSDNDTLKDGAEVLTHLTNPLLADTDGDSLSDSAEINTHNTDPLKKDTDGDALEDDDEISLGTDPRDTDTDNDNLLDGDEVSRGTNPKSKDSDTDGLDDDKEVLVHLTNPLNADTDGDLLSDSEEVSKGTDPKNDQDPKAIDTDGDGLKNFDEIYVHNTDPKKADTDGDGINDDVEITNGGDPLDVESDTDGDGLKDKVETRTKFFLSATNTGTDPYDSDSDNDGLSDKVETGTGKFVSMSNTGTNPNTPDTDGDGLDDKEETTGIRKTNHIAPVFTSSPFLIDTDGDLVGDFDESNARPKTNPRDPSKYPTIGGIKPISSLHALPVPLGDAQQVKINESFAPFGHRPDRDKVGDDGSGTIIDRNGVLIWTNKNGLAVTIPGSSLAKTLYVSNSECVVYKNRFAASYNSRSEKAEVVIYRREASGEAFSSKTIIIDGTVLDTCPVTPTTYGFTLVTGRAYEDGAESEREFEEVSGNPPVKAIKYEKTDQWDALSLNLNRITWDGELKLLSNRRLYVLNNVENLEDIIVQGTGSDGSIIFKTNIGQNLYAAIGQTFIAASESFWVSLEPGSERFEWLERDDTQSYRDANVAFLSNERALIERENNTGGYELIDWRQGANNSIVISGKFALSVGDRVLPVSNYSINGLPIYVHTTNSAKTKLNLYRADSEMTLLGSQNLTAKIKEPVSFVKNPRDASLLIKGETGGLIWMPTTTNGTTKAVTGLAAPRTIPNSAQGKPLFVTSKECVAWLNSDAPPLNGSLPPASISHFQIGTNGLIPANITPPMEGNYVVFPTALSPDPDLEGWYLSTFEKDAPASTLMRTYQLQLAGDTDRDRDGISDYDELTGRFSNANPKVSTDPMDPDTDDDGLSDGRELMPFVFVSSPLSWESARIAAINQGGKLAVLNSANKQVRFQTAMKAAKATGKFWIGGHDRLKEREFRWIANDGQATSGGSLVQSYVNWQDQQPSNFNDADAMEVSSAADFKWAMAPISRMQGYVIEYPFSDPNKADGSGDADGDGLADSDEVNVHKTNPNKADTDNDGLSDFTEAGVLFSNPLTGFLSGAPVTLAKASYEGLLYSEKNGLLGKISVNMENNGTFTGTYEIYNGFKSSIKGTLNKNNGLLVANSFAANPAIGATTIALQRDSQTRRNHLHVRVNNPTFGLLFAKARPAATGFKPVRSRVTLEAPLSEEASGPTGTMVATGSIAANGGIASLQMYNPDGTTASSSSRVLDGGVIALYAKSSGSVPTHVMANIKVNNVLNTKSNFDAQLRLLTNEYDQARTLEGSFYTAPAPRTLPISSFNASNTANNAVFNWTGGELDKAYQVNSWRPAEISPPKTNYDKTVATFTTATGLVKVDYTRSEEARNLYQVKSTAYAVVNQRKNTVNGFYSRLNWEGGSFSVNPNSLKLMVPSVTPPDAPIAVPGAVSSISPSTKSVGSGATTYDVVVTGVDKWNVSIPSSASWVKAEVVNQDGSVWGDKLTGNGDATVKVTITANSSLNNRSTTINIGGKNHTVTQAPILESGSVSSINPPSKEVRAAAETYNIRVTGTKNWTISIPSTSSWITAKVVNDNGFVYAAAPNVTGSGNAIIQVTIAINTTNKRRAGTINIGGKIHTVNQAFR